MTMEGWDLIIYVTSSAAKVPYGELPSIEVFERGTYN